MAAPALNEAAIQAVYDALVSHVEQTGNFARNPAPFVPLAPPGKGISFMMTESRIGPVSSGLAATSVRWEFVLRIMVPYQADRNQRSIEPKLTAATINVLAAFAGDINLTATGAPAGLVRDVDVLGPVTEPGWADMDGGRFRVRDITIGVVINDAYAQAGA